MQQDKTVRRRQRRSAEEKQSLLAAWRASGLSAREFSRREGVQKTCLWRWSRESGLTVSSAATAKTSIKFAPVHIASERPKGASTDERVVAEVVVHDVRVRVVEGAETSQIVSLVKALTRGLAC
jgi:transposase-like protein